MTWDEGCKISHFSFVQWNFGLLWAFVFSLSKLMKSSLCGGKGTRPHRRKGIRANSNLLTLVTLKMLLLHMQRRGWHLVSHSLHPSRWHCHGQDTSSGNRTPWRLSRWSWSTWQLLGLYHRRRGHWFAHVFLVLPHWREWLKVHFIYLI